MELGMGTILYGSHPLDAALDGIKKAGYKAIELAALPGMANHLEINQPKEYYAKIKDACGRRSLVIESVGGAGTNVSDPAGRERYVGLLKAAKELGVPAVTLGSGGKAGDEASYKEIVAAWKEAAKIAADIGIIASIKPHVGGAAYGTESTLRFMKEINSPFVRVNFDASHIWRTPEQEDPVASQKALAPYIATARIRDTLSKEQKIGPVENQIPGGGALPLKALMDGFKKIPGLKYVTVEMVGSNGFTLEKVQEIVDKTKRELDKLLQ